MIEPLMRNNIRTIEVSVLGERFTYNFIMDEEALTRPGEVEYLIEAITRAFKESLVQKFKKEMERVEPWKKING